MDCKKCGQVLEGSVKFCGKCGEKVTDIIETSELQSNSNISAEKVCEKCNGTIREGAKFCRHCGEVVKDDTNIVLSKASLTNNMSLVIKNDLTKYLNLIKKPVTQIVGGFILGFIVLIVIFNNRSQALDIVESQLMVFQKDGDYYGKLLGKEKFSVDITNTNNLTKYLNLIKKPVTQIVSGFILGLIVLIFIFSNRSQALDISESQLMVFQKDEDYYGKFLGKEKFSIDITNTNNLIVTRDSKKIYLLEDGDLYVKEGQKDREKIARDVTNFAISPYGETVAYVKAEENNVGPLYVKKGKKEPEKISSQALPIIDISDNGKYISFIEGESIDFIEDAEGYIYEVGKEKKKLNKVLPIMVNDKGTVIGRNKENALYIVKKGKGEDKISNTATQLLVNKDLSKLAFVDESNNLYIYNGKDKEKIEGDIQYIANNAIIKRGVYHSYNYSQLATKEMNLLYLKKSSFNFKIEGQEAEKITPNLTYDSVEYAQDMKSFAYINKESLYIKMFNNKKMIFDEEIDSDVTNIYISKNGKHVAYIKDGDLYYIKSGDKKSKKVATDIYEVAVQNNGAIYFEDDDNTLYISKNRKDKEKILEDVQTWGSDSEGNLYLVDNEGVLFEKELNKKMQKVSEEVYSEEISFHYVRTLFSTYNNY